MRAIWIGVLASASVTGQTVINGGRSILGAWDASRATSTRPHRQGTLAARPISCQAGESYLATDAPASRQVFVCAATNTWSASGYLEGTQVPATCSGAQLFFKTDAAPGQNLHLCNGSTFSAVAGGTGGSGDVAGPTSVADATLPRFSGTSGKVLRGSGVVVDDANHVSGARSVTTGDGTTAGEVLLYETAGNGTDYVGWLAPDSVMQALKYRLPAAGPTAGQVLQAGAPSGGVVELSWGTASSGAGLPDPGSNGLVKRTGTNVTTVGAAGTDYYAPGTVVASADLPNPTTSAGGRVRASACTGGDFVKNVNTDSTVTCATPSTGLGSATQVNDVAGNAVVKTPASALASPANEVTVSNAVAGAAPSVSASGTDANVDLALRGKGAGKVDLGAVGSVRISGGANGQVLQTDGNGVLSFATVTGGSGSGMTVQGGGVALPQRATLDVRDGLEAVDDAANARTELRLDPTDPTVAMDWDNFCTGGTSSLSVGRLAWSRSNLNSGTAVGVTYGAGQLGNPCEMTAAGVSTTAVDHGSSIYLNTALFGDLTSRVGAKVEFVFRLGSATDNRFRAGLASATNTLMGNQTIGVRADQSAAFGDATFRLVVCNGATAADCDVVNTGRAIDTNPHRVQIRTLTAGTVLLRFDDGAEQAFTGGKLPAGTVDFYPVVAQGNAAVVAAGRTVMLSRFSYRLRGLVRY